MNENAEQFKHAVTVLRGWKAGTKIAYTPEEMGEWLETVDALRAVSISHFAKEFGKLLHDAKAKDGTPDAKFTALFNAVMVKPVEPKPEPTPKPKTYFKFETMDEVISSPPKEWLIDHVIGFGDTVMIYGESYSGKTFILIELAFALARGEGKFAGSFTINRPAKVLYMTGEGRSGLAERFKAAALTHNPTDEEKSRAMVVRSVAQFVNPGAPNYYTVLIDDMVSYGFIPDVIMIDHLSSTVPGKGDADQPAATLVAAAVSDIQDRLGCTVLFSHHTGYDKSHGRGMTNYKDILDIQIEIANKDNPHVMTCKKDKEATPWKGHQFTIDRVEGTDSAAITWGGMVKSKRSPVENQLIWMLELVEEAPGLNQTQLVVLTEDRLGWGRSKVLERLGRLVAEGKVEQKTKGKSILYYVK